MCPHIFTSWLRLITHPDYEVLVLFDSFIYEVSPSFGLSFAPKLA